MDTLGQKIKKARLEKGLTQTELAERIGVKSHTVISNWENDINKPFVNMIEYLCGALDVAPRYFFPEDYQPTDEDLKVALFGGAGEVTDEMWEEAVNYAQYIKEREAKKKGK